MVPLPFGISSVRLGEAVAFVPGLDEKGEEWKNAVCIEEFYRAGGNPEPVAGTKCFLLWDEKALYVRFECADRNRVMREGGAMTEQALRDAEIILDQENDRIRKEKERTPDWRKIRGIPPATAPIKKYMEGRVYRSMIPKRGFAKSTMPVTDPRQNKRRKIKFLFLSFRKELTEDISLSYIPIIIAMEPPLTPGTSMVPPMISPFKNVPTVVSSNLFSPFLIHPPFLLRRPYT